MCPLESRFQSNHFDVFNVSFLLHVSLEAHQQACSHSGFGMVLRTFPGDHAMQTCSFILRASKIAARASFAIVIGQNICLVSLLHHSLLQAGWVLMRCAPCHLSVDVWCPRAEPYNIIRKLLAYFSAHAVRDIWDQRTHSL